MMRHGTRVVVCLIALLLSAAPGVVSACTLWAAAGERVVGGGTMIHKNRDWSPDHQQELRLVTPQKGYRYLSLYTVGNESNGTKAGVNTEGLVIVTASAPSHLDKRINFLGRTGMATLLSRYGSVDQALQALDAAKWKSGPQFIIMADKTEIASIEVGMEGQYVILSRSSNDVLFHTNHYVSETLAGFNQAKIGKSSMTRYERISKLLESKPVLDLDDTRSFSKDSTLWRKGATPTSVRTLSAWTIQHRADGHSVLVLTMANPGRMETNYEIPLADAFAGKFDVSVVQ
ncbi:MAG: carcinine hydrolase/isopenicillin-N N-acyltransferase family protein [Negativicutes bacterium]